MDKKLNADYVQGYVDATKQMNNMIEIAIADHKFDFVATINKIITIMHKQQNEVRCMVNEHEKQTIEEFLFDNKDIESSFENFAKEIFGDKVQIVVVKGGK